MIQVNVLFKSIYVNMDECIYIRRPTCINRYIGISQKYKFIFTKE